MSNSFSLDTLTEGIRQRHLGAHNKRLVEKWSRTGLLRGLEGVHRENMAALMENQASQLLREASTLSTGAGALSSSGDLKGFTNIAFPIVRRVFGGLVANELVSIQPMSLPSGLLFYLDYTYGADETNITSGVSDNTAMYSSGSSIYNNPTGKGVRSGSFGAGGQYDLAGSGYSRVHENAEGVTLLGSGSYQGTSTFQNNGDLHATGTDGRLIQFDPLLTKRIEDATHAYQAVFVSLTTAKFSNADLTMVKDFGLHINGATRANGVGWEEIDNKVQGGRGLFNVRRLNELGSFDGSTFTADPLIAAGDSNATIKMVVSGVTNGAQDNLANVDCTFVQSPSLSSGANEGDTLVIPSFESNLASGTPSPAIPEIDIKVESIAVVAQTRKLRAKWSPELAQDLNAYHSLDAEVELTQILSEQIALELDREILNDLLTQANGANLFWSRAPGKFVNKETGVEVQQSTSLAPGPSFTGTVREWYETLVETIIDVANTIHRKTLRGSANFIVIGPDVATMLEASVLYRPDYSLDGEGQVGAPFTLGAEKVGTLSNRFTTYKDPYFPRNKILVGYKGGSYLETGYVYAPYVPLIVTPTIFAPEDFTPRKGVMTRYGKKMVRADFYGTVTIADLNII